MFKPENFFDLSSFEHADLFEGIENIWEVLGRLHTYLLAHTPEENEIRGKVHPGAYLIGKHILIEEQALVEPGAYIEGPCIIGRGSHVRHGAYIRSDTLAARDSLIGHATETKNAILLPESKAAHFAYIGDSILGQRVNLGAGTKLANFQLGGRVISVRINGQRYSTGRNKLGAILGDDCQLGCNSVCNPGTFLGPRSLVHALVSVSGYHPAATKLKLPTV